MTTAPGSDRRLIINAAANWVGFAAQMAAALVLAPILVRELGDQRYGVWSLVESILAYLLLFDLGVAASLVRYVARFEAARDRDSLNRVYSTSLCIFAAAGAVVLALALGVAWIGLHRWQIAPELVGEAHSMLILLGVNLAIGLPLSVYPSILDGLERYPLKTAVRTGALVLRSLLFLVIVWRGGGLIELAWAITACNLAEHAALMLAAWRCLPGLRFSFRQVDRETFRTIRGYSVQAFLALVAGRISFQTDALVIGAFLAPQYITFFILAARLVEYAKSALRSITTVFTPAVSALDAQGNTDAIRRVLLNGTRSVMWLILPIQAGLLIWGKAFLRLWVGEERAEASYPVLVILALPLFLALTQSVAARILYGVGRLGWFVRVVVAEAVLNLLLSVILVGPFGIEGVAWGTTIPNLLANLLVIGHVCRMLGQGIGDYLRQAFLRPSLGAALLATGWIAVRAHCVIDGWAELLAVGVAGVMAYGLLAALLELGPAAVRLRWKREKPLTA